MSRLRALAPFALLSLLWGLSFPAISIGLENIPPLLFASFRYDIAAVLLLAVAVTGAGWKPESRGDYEAVVGGGLFLIGANGFLFIGQQTVPAGVAAILQGLVPIATALWALLLLGERVSAVGFLGILLGFVGVGLVVRPTPENLVSGDIVGRLLVLLQVAGVSLGGVVVQQADSSLDATPRAAWSMLVGAVLLHLVSLGLGEQVALDYPLAAVGAVIYLGVFATAIAFILFFRVLDRYGAVETSLVGYVVPIVATIASVFLLNEPITLVTLLGFVVVFVGFLLLKRSALRTMFT
ncbi:DMT family transporter [Halorarius litoreus]|uniref:DMT family transporter n=1 Tax=Halorarius litoreus TaxID=2962676 RepID=UPI0020CF5E99|nr:EamA family transporter [Halorarius litoreus]